MEKKINLEEIFKAKAFYNLCLYGLNDNQKQCVLDVMKEACKQALELAAENADIEIKEVGEDLIVTDYYDQDYTKIRVNKQSILNVINEIE